MTIVATRPTTAPMTRTDAFVVTGNRQERQLADIITLLSERPAHAVPIRPTSVAITSCCPAGQRGVDLGGDRPAEAGGIVDVIRFDPLGEEPERADDEQRQRHEEEEQPERERTADDRSCCLPVALVDP